MANLFNNLGKKLGESFSEATTQSAVDNQRQGELAKLNTKLKDIDIKLEKRYTLLGQEVATIIRKEQDLSTDSLKSFLKPIQELDKEKVQILEEIKALKAQQADQLKGEELLRIKKEVEIEIQKLKELHSLGVIDEDEFEISEAKLSKRVDNFEKLYSLKVALERGLINQQEYNNRKASLE